MRDWLSTYHPAILDRYEEDVRQLYGDFDDAYALVPGEEQEAATVQSLMRAVREMAEFAMAVQQWFDDTTEPCEPGCDCIHDQAKRFAALVPGEEQEASDE
jgi:hypothetical protein